ncbi:hypothetical protein AAY473_013653 [Plecturocebus cupreus]
MPHLTGTLQATAGPSCERASSVTGGDMGSRTTGFHRVGQAGLELLTSGDPPALASKKSSKQNPLFCAVVVMEEAAVLFMVTQPQPAVWRRQGSRIVCSICWVYLRVLEVFGMATLSLPYLVGVARRELSWWGSGRSQLCSTLDNAVVCSVEWVPRPSMGPGRGNKPDNCLAKSMKHGILICFLLTYRSGHVILSLADTILCPSRSPPQSPPLSLEAGY